jgi:hypothetical protein
MVVVDRYLNFLRSKWRYPVLVSIYACLATIALAYFFLGLKEQNRLEAGFAFFSMVWCGINILFEQIVKTKPWPSVDKWLSK